MRAWRTRMSSESVRNCSLSLQLAAVTSSLPRRPTPRFSPPLPLPRCSYSSSSSLSPSSFSAGKESEDGSLIPAPQKYRASYPRDPQKNEPPPPKKKREKNEIRDPGLCRRRHRLPPRLPGQALALPTSLGRPRQHTGSRRDHRSPPWEASGHRGRRQRGSRRRRRALARRRARRRGPLPREPPSTRTFLDGRRDPADSLRLGGPGPVPSRPRLGLGADPLRQRGPRVGKRRDLLHRLDRRPSGAASEVARNPGLRHVLHVAGLALLGRPGGQALPPRPEHGENCGGLDGELV